jgi:hypothetical protein
MTAHLCWILGALTCALALTACGTDEEGNGGGGGDTSGTSGTSGADGTSGGTSGTSGADGTSGTSGADGTSGGGDTSGGGCGDITERGVCDGNTLKFCREGELLSFACADGYFEAELFGQVTGTCQLVSEAEGYDCVVATGDVCVGVEPHGDHNHYYPVLCAGSGQGCVNVSDDKFVCQAGVGACEETFSDPFCLGDILVVECALSQPIGFDCKALGGECEVHDGHAVCGDLPEGAACEPEHHDDHGHGHGHGHDHGHGGGFEPKTECAAGLTCSEVSKTCIPAAPAPAP